MWNELSWLFLFAFLSWWVTSKIFSWVYWLFVLHLFKIFRFYLFLLYVWVNYVCAPPVCNAQGGQKRALESQTAETLWVSGTGTTSSRKGARAISPASYTSSFENFLIIYFCSQFLLIECLLIDFIAHVCKWACVLVCECVNVVYFSLFLYYRY